MIWTVALLAGIVVLQHISFHLYARRTDAERRSLVNHLLAEKPHEYVALQRADTAKPRDPERPNRPEKIHPEGL